MPTAENGGRLVDDPLNGELSGLWRDALTAYCDETGHEASEGIRNINPVTLEDLDREIDAKFSSFKAFRSQHGKVYDSIQRCMYPVRSIAKIASQLGDTSSVGAPLVITMGAVIHLITAAEHVAEAYDWIEDVFNELCEYTGRISSYMSSNMPPPLRRKIVHILTFLIRILGRSENMIKGRTQRWRKFVKNAFLGQDKETKTLLDDLNRALANEQGLVVALTYAKVSENQDSTSSVLSQTAQILRQNARLLEHSLDAEAIKNIKYTFKTPAADTTEGWFGQHKAKLLKGTGSWLKKESLFSAWHRQEALILWILGGPGSGKTMLSTWLIETSLSMMDDNRPHSSVHVAYFYVRQDDKELTSLRSIFKTLIWQLQTTDEVFRQHVGMLAQQSRHKISGVDGMWKNCFLDYYTSPLSKGRRAIIIIDGLDEAEVEERRHLVSILEDFRKTLLPVPQSLQLAIFGRETLRTNLHDARLVDARNLITVSSNKNREDLNDFIKHRVQNLAVVKSMRSRTGPGPVFTDKYVRTLRKRVLQGADGVFTWARIILDQIQNLEESKIEKLLSDPPKDLDDMIVRVLERLCHENEETVDTMAKILLWVSGSRRPLSFGELELILKLGGDSTYLLWGQFHGQFASIFSLRYPRGYDPDAQVVESESELKSTGLGDTGDDDPVSVDVEDTFGSDMDSDLGSSEDEEQRLDGAKASVDHFVSAGPVYDLQQRHTIVEFSHARFRDIVDAKGALPEVERATLPVLGYIGQSAFWLFEGCMAMMREGLRQELPEQKFSLAYPTSNILLHLQAIDPESLETDQRGIVLDRLDWLLREDNGCNALFKGLLERNNGECDALWRMWFTNGDNIRSIQQWLSSAPDTGEDDRDSWTRRAARSAKTLLQPLARIAAEFWLEKLEGFHDIGYFDKSEFQVWFLKGYMSMNEQGEVPDEISTFVWARDMRMSRLSLEEIVILAEWAGLDKTTHWYAGVGWTLFEAGHYSAAVEYCDKAIEMDPNAWVAMEAKARCLSACEDYSRAVDEIHRAMRVLPDNMRGALAYHLSYCAKWLKRLGRLQESRKMVDEAFDENPQAPIAIDGMLDALNDEENWSYYLIILQWLDQCLYSHRATALTEYLSVYSTIPAGAGRACREGGKPQFMLDAVETTLEHIQAQGDELETISYICDAALFRYEWYDEDERPLELLEEASRRFSASDTKFRSENRGQFQEPVNKYAQICFDMAVKHHKFDSGPNKFHVKLKRLATTTETENLEIQDEIFEYYSADYPSLLLGRWLRDYGNAKEEKWKKCYRARVLRLLSELDDEDPENDTSACQSLAVALFQAGDEVSASEILATLFKPLDELLKNSGTKGDEEEEDFTKSSQANKDIGEEKHEAVQTESHQDTQSLAGQKNPANQSIESAGSNTPSKQDITMTSAVLPPEHPVVGLLNMSIIEHAPNAQIIIPSMDGLVISSNEPKDAKNQTTTPDFPELQQTAQVEEELQLHLRESWGYWCDLCDRSAFEAESMVFCQICFNTNFCDDCLSKVKDGTLSRRLCNPEHVWYKAWPIPNGKFEAMAHSQAAGNVVLKKEWLENIRRKWLLENGVAK